MGRNKWLNTQVKTGTAELSHGSGALLQGSDDATGVGMAADGCAADGADVGADR